MSVKLNSEQKRIIWLSSMGGMLEFYDFTIYGLFSVYFAHQFFPRFDNFAAIIASFSIFVVGYVVRPIGGIIFSHIGDEIGRKTVMILTMILMGIASLGMGLLPTYDKLGIWAPILMVLLRLIQGLAIGGEIPSMVVYVAESIPDNKPFAMGGIFTGALSGLVPGMLIDKLITHYLTVEQVNSFGWRIPFLLGGFLCFIGYQIRRKLHETAAFKNLERRDRFPFAELINHHLGKVFIGIGLVSIMATPIILVILFMPTYLTKILTYTAEQAADAVLIATLVLMSTTYMMGYIASKFSPYTLMRNCTVLLVLAGAACYFMLANQYNLTIAIVIFAIFQGFLVTIPPVLLSNLFPVHIRLSGVALSYNLGFVFFGGLTPIVITTIVKHTGLVYIAPFLCMLTTAVVTLIALTKCRKYL